MFKKYDATKLLDDIKIISKIVKISRDENNPENRNFDCSVVEDLLNRLYNDINEMTKGYVEPEEYDGSNNLEE